MNPRRRSARRAAWLLTLALVVTPAIAAAYPQYTLSRQTTCAACHVSPAGSGLLDGMGEVTAEEDASWGGDGRFLSGRVELPEWLKAGGDFRFAGGASDKGAGIGGAAFPMQLEGYAAITKGAVTGYATLGLVRPNEDSPASVIQTREHWVMYRPSAEEGYYVRAGRFQPVYGLRLSEHVFYVRRYGGAQLYGETYGVNAGWVSDSVEAHVTGFIKDPLRDSSELGNGAAIYVEKRLGQEAAVGAQARYAKSDLDTRAQAGLTGKLWIPCADLLLQAEAGLTQQDFDAGSGRTQLTSQLLASWFFKRGFFLDVGVGQYNADLSLKYQDRTAVDANLHWFPSAHWELVLMGRVQTIGFGNGGPGSGFTLLQVHYRL